MLNDSDLAAVSEKLRLVSIDEDDRGEKSPELTELRKSDEELARILQVFFSQLYMLIFFS